MELLESDDPKSQLLKKSAHHRQELEDEVKSISERTEKIVTNALIIGGALALTYFAVRQFSETKKKKHKGKVKKLKLVREDNAETEEAEMEESSSAPGIVAQIGTALASQASVFLLNLAKEKLSEYLESQSAKKEKDA
ncbi:MAG TPA: hypothetical protein VGK59_05275 [Ohtaekwangia sp.]